MITIAFGDPAALRDALLDLVDRTDELDEYKLERALGQFIARHLTSGAGASAQMSAIEGNPDIHRRCAEGPRLTQSGQSVDLILSPRRRWRATTSAR